MNILLTGRPGTGKTWVMKSLIENYETNKQGKVGLIDYLYNDELAITGKYVGEVFDGSDKLSMAAVSSVADFIDAVDVPVRVFEGDRFTNNSFLKVADPFVINIEGDGSEGIKMRGSSQTEQRLKAMKTRYNNFQYHVRVPNSNECLEMVKAIIAGEFETKDLHLLNGDNQINLF